MGKMEELADETEERYGEDTAEKFVEHYSGSGSALPEGTIDQVMDKIDSKLPEIYPERFLENRYENETIDRLYSIIERSEPIYGDLHEGFEESLEPEDFMHTDSVVLDHSTVIGLSNKENMMSHLTEGQLVRWHGVLDMLNVMENSEEEYTVMVPENIYDKTSEKDIFLTSNKHQYRALYNLKKVDNIKHFNLPDEESEDQALAQISENTDSVLVTLDSDFLELEQEYDIAAYSPHMAQLGFKLKEENVSKL